ncbi:sporulation protein YunB [Sediminibacillus dalangtanensis]|uniref:Sporulation protein YunB n=1 Tax=Sediminibacillus dalangtanensis TaxID=2729421 RepID=A0ABX7VW03_9BACI|nr:sporulation protein YunB [Sediminibacillus dalangtanensis]QTN00210.1 sporulation protein YunB [Sediminibacillus dalangtanensis]
MKKNRNFKSHMTPPPFRHVLVVTIVFFTISSFVSILIINRGLEPTLMDIAETRARQYARMAINEAVSKKIADDLEYDELIQEKVDNEGNAVSVGWNSVVTNRVVRNTTNRVQNFLKLLEKGQVPDPGSTLDVELEPEEKPSIESVKEEPTLIQIPVGQALGIPLLANLGPDIPVNIEVIGDVQSEPIMEREELGINNVYFALYVEMEVSLRVVVPFQTKTTQINSKIKIDDRVVSFDVPYYYNGNGGGESPQLSIPMEPLQ